jgi:hypothetical protein
VLRKISDLFFVISHMIGSRIRRSVPSMVMLSVITAVLASCRLIPRKPRWMIHRSSVSKKQHSPSAEQSMDSHRYPNRLMGVWNLRPTGS